MRLNILSCLRNFDLPDATVLATGVKYWNRLRGQMPVQGTKKKEQLFSFLGILGSE